jgi:LysR family transcriptional regulator, hydrogen peroxide-inducible genes activator
MKTLPSLKQLEYLTALAETRHFAQASDLCNVTPSTLSAGIKDLEGVLGIPLAERTKRKVMMTHMGKEIAARARLLLRDAEDIMELAATERDPMTGILKLGVIPTIGPFLLPSVLPGLSDAHPDLRLYLVEEKTNVLLARLRAGEIDLALIALPFETEGLAARVLFDDVFHFACHAHHPLAGRGEITDADLADQSLLLLEEGHCLRGHALDACHARATTVRIEFEATSLHTLVQMTAQDMGVTLLPQLAIDANVTGTSDIRLVPLASRESRQIGLVWRDTSPRAKAIESIAEAFAAPATRQNSSTALR